MNRVTLIIAGLLVLAGCGAPQPAAPVPTPASRVATTMPTLAPTTTATTTAASATTALTAVATPTRVPTAPPAPTVAPTAITPTVTSTPKALHYVFPVKAARYDISSSHHDYPAADIACPIGSGFVAVTSGVVDYVSFTDPWPKTQKSADKGGISVALVGDDGLRYYGSHLSSIAAGIKPGVRVQAGQLLGLTGESGNAKGVYPQLHFGISHPTQPDDWQTRRGEIWPQKYLSAWLRGEDVTPKR